MPSAPYTNQDAAFLSELAQSPDLTIEQTMRLQQAAENLQRLDSRVLALTATTDVAQYEEGIQEGYRRAYERSNIPAPDRTPFMSMHREASRNPVTVKRIPMGQSGLVEPKQPKAKKKLSGLNIVLNLSGFTTKPTETKE